MAAPAASALDLGAADAVDAMRSEGLSRAKLVEALLQRFDDSRFGFAMAQSFTPEGARARAGLAAPEPTLEEQLAAREAKPAAGDNGEAGEEADDEDDPEAAARRKARKAVAAAAAEAAAKRKAEADAADADPKPDTAGALAGLPVAVSDTLDVRGLATSASNTAMAQWRARRSAAVVRRLVAAGAFVLGKTSVHDLGWGHTGSRTPRGRVANPYSMGDCIAGGAAAGAAAAVSARVAPAALAVDSLGDARVPASCCGVVAFRPSSGRYPAAGCLMTAPTMDTVAVLARHVEDVQLLDAALSTSIKGEASPRGQGRRAGGGADARAAAAASGESDPEAEAAVSLQAGARGFLARRRAKAAKEERERHEAAAMIQSIARGRAARSRVAQMTAISESDGDGAAAPGSASESKDAEEDDEGAAAAAEASGDADAAMSFGQAEEEAAVRIQAVARGRESRSRVSRLRRDKRAQGETEAAIRIQAISRGRRARMATTQQLARQARAGDVDAAATAKAAFKAGEDGSLTAGLSGLRLGLPACLLADCDSTVKTVVADTVAKLEAAGAVVVRGELPKVAAAGDPAGRATVNAVVRAGQVCAAVRGYEALRELAAYLSARGLDRDRVVVVEAPKKRKAEEGEEEEEEEEEDGEAGAAAAGPKLAKVTVRTTVADVVDAYCGSATDRAALVAAMDPRGSVADGGSAVDAGEYADALGPGREAVVQSVRAFMTRHKVEAILYPSLMVPAVAEKGSDGDAVYCNGALVSTRHALTRNASLASAAGLPACTVPAGMTRKRASAGVGVPGGERMPVGVEVAGLPGSDARLLAVARALQGVVAALPDPVLRSRWQRGVVRS
ncbi:hypothetical protein FNF29_02520 [Cafeteria roenbergensis]|uniref:Amidase domain-containing protein n=1 Tax=Cafeteria roenbergensis TaxID=33653 RepID=A0A5A8CQ38_CAFRO|nr:hypothetical protein FNF29_02520 [Cafeteria roenbergensis]|eukprot:KAA0154300.1 hypothetical protein FNF29_02520 [Cafeteria roenbergensis]